MFEIAMNNQMQIATNQRTANTGLCGTASCGNRVVSATDARECVNLHNAMVNGDYLFIEGAFSPGATAGGILVVLHIYIFGIWVID